jgi:hypothetical protein
MFVATQDGIFTAVRDSHNHLTITSDNPDALNRLIVFLKDSFIDKYPTSIVITDQEWVAFLTAHTQDIQYKEFPPAE